jgi:hypothetical protein
MDDFSALDASQHMLEWFDDNPYAAIRREIIVMLDGQVQGSILLHLNVSGPPDWLSTGRPGNDDPEKAVLVRAGLAFPIELQVATPNDGEHLLTGIYTWVATGMDTPGARRQRVWLDLDGNLKTFGSDGLLRERLYFDEDTAAMADSLES